VPLPELPEQRRIVDLLTRAEGIVRLRREAAAKAAELIPAIFIDMFGDPATNPKGWPALPLGSVATVQGGLQVTRAREVLPLERPYLRVANVHRGRLDLAELKSIRLTDAEFQRTRLEMGDLLFVEGHGNPEEVGRVAVWDASVDGCTHQNHLIRARTHVDQLLPAYACTLLNTPGGRQSLLRAGKTTSGLSTISTKNVKEATVMLPPIDRQGIFVKQAQDAGSIARLQVEAMVKAQATFSALLAQAFAAPTSSASTQA
jgi:type I restriction enzyme S subunit